MRIINLNRRLSLLLDDGIVDVERASKGQFSSDVQSVYGRWADFEKWGRAFDGPPTGPLPSRETDIVGAPAPRPPQVFAVGLNYRSHAAEASIDTPDSPLVFTKFPASIAGPYDTIELPSQNVDFEVELVAVVGMYSRRIAVEDGWSCIAGLTLGQDLSERVIQSAPPVPQQFNLAKSFAGFSPIGPCLATLDEFADPADVPISCILSTEPMQHGRTSDLIFSIPALVAYLSSVLPLLPGDLIFTGTPSGVGWARNPRRLITPDDELISTAEGIGTMHHRFVTASPL